MACIIIEGDPGHLRHLLDELYDRNYLPPQLNAELFVSTDSAIVKVLGAIVEAINDAIYACKDPILTADQLKVLGIAETMVSVAKPKKE